MENHPLMSFFERFPAITFEEKSRIIKHFKSQTFPKKSLIVNFGDINDKLYFIEFGILREFSYLNEDRDLTITHWLMSAGHFIYLAESFLENKPTKVLLETIERTKVWYITKKDLESLRLEIPAFNVMGQTITEQYLLKYERFITMLRTKEDKRYRWFDIFHKDLANTVPLKYIATYLNMRPETLSRIRAKRRKR